MSWPDVRLQKMQVDESEDASVSRPMLLRVLHTGQDAAAIKMTNKVMLAVQHATSTTLQRTCFGLLPRLHDTLPRLASYPHGTS